MPGAEWKALPPSKRADAQDVGSEGFLHLSDSGVMGLGFRVLEFRGLRVSSSRF